MPETLEAALVFAVLIVPGYQLVRGFALARDAPPPGVQLYVLAQAVVASLAWLAITWPAVINLLQWVRTDTVDEHRFWSYLTVPLLLGLPYLAGRALGRFVVAITRDHERWGPYWLWRMAATVGLVEPMTPWDEFWRRATASAEQASIVTVTLQDGSVLHGQFGSGSLVSAPPASPAVYFELAYDEDPATGAPVVYTGGAHVDGTRIVALRLRAS